ncbi:TIGR03032 family protein [Methylogaea oryzae]|uniref:TIGR03032 family protein n=1 Tax=Methylogaea oryzae TaxID=1295382 RepID=A0A8D5AJ19_9GAMM|nr:TIGR03032 family protein [Methylogaea oryzae]BBL69586.1 TIGR03032 family protein [Methylogaea oryzae]
MAEVGMKNVVAQEQAGKPTLHASPQLGAWLQAVGGSLAFTTYQSGRLFLLSPADDGQTLALERILGSAMGLAVGADYLWVANQQQIWRFADTGPRELGGRHYDAVYLPRQGYLLGGCDAHDILADVQFLGRRHELLFVNTRFSCIAALDAHYNFRPVWRPGFISALAPEDRCHLNGMGQRDGELAFATLCGRYDTAMGWREMKSGGGCVVDVPSGETLCSGLSMPHSPRWHDGKLWLLNSGDGDLGYVDAAGRFNSVYQCPGFARGLCFVDGYAVVGLSKLRPNTFASGLNIKERLESQNIRETCGLLVIDPRSGKSVHWLTLEGPVTELYDVAFLPGTTKPYTPGFSEPDLHRALFRLPETEFAVSLSECPPGE